MKKITLPRTLIPLIEELDKHIEDFHRACQAFTPDVSNLELADLHTRKHASETMIVSTAHRIVLAAVKNVKERKPSATPRQPRKVRQSLSLAEQFSTPSLPSV